MPSIHYLNPPPNPFWDFVANLEDHPFFAGQGPPPNYTSRENVAPQTDANAPTENQGQASQPSEKAKGKQASAEDPPEVDPSTLREAGNDAQIPEGLSDGPRRGRGHCARASQEDGERPHRGHDRRGRGGFGGRGGWGGPHHHHPGVHIGPYSTPSFMGHHGLFWARGPPGPPGPDSPENQQAHPHPHPHHGPGHHHRGGPHAHRGRGGCSPPEGRHGRGAGFNLPEFLNNLGSRLGVDLSGAAEGLGLDRFAGPRNNQDSDFEPRGDIFDTPADYKIHLSLPGAKKEDVGVDWDGESSVLRIAGVVHRPGADEQLLSHLVVDQRKREVGVFEKSIRLGTRREPASIDVAGISAKMTDGVLIVTVPKVEIEHHKREVPITGSKTLSPARNEKEQESRLDNTDKEMYDSAAVEKEQIAANEYHDTRSDTMEFEHDEKAPDHAVEEASEESDWEKAGSEDEGEYIKINVD